MQKTKRFCLKDLNDLQKEMQKGNVFEAKVNNYKRYHMD